MKKKAYDPTVDNNPVYNEKVAKILDEAMKIMRDNGMPFLILVQTGEDATRTCYSMLEGAFGPPAYALVALEQVGAVISGGVSEPGAENN